MDAMTALNRLFALGAAACLAVAAVVVVQAQDTGTWVATANSTTLTAPGAEADVAMATAVLTQPDFGAVEQTTSRWPGDRPVRYSLEIPADWPVEFHQAVADAIAWTAAATGLEYVQVADPADADMEIRSIGEDRGRARLAISDGVIAHATIDLGCCRPRVPWEEIAQSAGALGDHADSRSVFSNDQTAVTASEFDRWVLATLYSLPPRSSAADVTAALQASHATN